MRIRGSGGPFPRHGPRAAGTAAIGAVVLACLILAAASAGAVAASGARAYVNTPLPASVHPTLPHPSAAALAALRAALDADVSAQPPGTLSIVYRDLGTGQTFAVGAEQAWDPASVIKLFVMAAAYARRAAGALDFQEPITISAANVVPTAGFDDGEYPGLYEGITTTVDTLVGAMITQSDNTAYNTLLDLLGWARVTAYVHSLGLRHTVVARKLNQDPDAAAADGADVDGAENTTTADDVAALYLLLYENKVPFADEMLHLLARQKQNYMLPAGLPAHARMAHKTGEVDDTLRHDGGIVYLPGGAEFLLVVFSSLGSYAELAGIAAQVARAYPPPAAGAAARPPAVLTAPVPSALPGVLRLLLIIASASLLFLVAVLDRGGGRAARRARLRR
jgi:beta-lactamase class A